LVIVLPIFSQTNIDIKVENGIIMELLADGHTGYAETGYDIVCAVISSTLRTYLYIVRETRNLKVEYDVSRSGYMSILITEMKINNTLKEQLRGMSRFLIRTLNDLKEEYPKYINVKISSS
jgi:uncharacterized protein YsxB (DUF464 family)